MTYKSPYGKVEGLRDRLVQWRKSLGEDRSFPWVGLGLIEDLEVAISVLDGHPRDAIPEPAGKTYDL